MIIILKPLAASRKLAGGGGRVGPKVTSIGWKKIKKELTGAYSLILWDFKRKDKMIKKDNDPFGFTKAINWDKLEDPKVLKELEKIFDEEEKDEENKT